MINTSNFVDGACIRSAPVYANDLNITTEDNPALAVRYNATLEDSGNGHPMRVFLRTTRDINPQEEIYVDYGRSYWEASPSKNITRSHKFRRPTRPTGNPSPPAPLPIIA